MEKIYLGDWLYNAGIVGFLRINSHLWHVKDEKLISKDENLLKIGDNYIEIDRKIFDGFTDRFFNYAFNLYGRYDRKLKKFKDKQDKEELIESNVREFLENFYGQKSFLNISVKKDRKKKFYEDFEKPLKTDNNQKDKKFTCVICGERPAKKDTNYDTGFSTIFGLNKDAVNFAWNFNTKLPSCDVCEIIYFCHFAGLTELNGKYYFVNLDDSVELLLVKNNYFEEVIEKAKEKSSENPIIDFFAKYLLSLKREQVNYTLRNTNFLEIEIKEMSKKSKKKIAKVFSFNIDYKTAKFIEKNHENLKSLSKSFFILPDKTRVYILTEFLNLILKKDLNYELLYKIFKSST
jgi:CRISPR-associated protein Cst1